VPQVLLLSGWLRFRATLTHTQLLINRLGMNERRQKDRAKEMGNTNQYQLSRIGSAATNNRHRHITRLLFLNPRGKAGSIK
jgi:hypothetical protein